jgi:murein DD-endopeptidase MepM/ murein hydrolase activator NlpD
VPIGTAVHAARDGVVIGTNPTSNESSRDGFKNARANYVWVRHSDGTIGCYLHLRQGGVAVAVGQAVKTGQLLGYSGCTGQCRGPHLHFHVSTPLQARMAQIPGPTHAVVGGLRCDAAALVLDWRALLQLGYLHEIDAIRPCRDHGDPRSAGHR